jgi:hypothetical protein
MKLTPEQTAKQVEINKRNRRKLVANGWKYYARLVPPALFEVLDKTACSWRISNPSVKKRLA